ncbi:MAG: hypothetical protein EXS47_00590 [Candidatus Zambryskibacteria bacterium]|nr:hypothetical protein [Candidatus Zambryskibacteria bacterium]
MEKLSWETIEYLHTEKTSDWYWIVGIITISIALISIILNNVIFALLIIVASFTLSLFASRRPEKIKIEISNSGVQVGKTKYSYHELESFWVETREVHHRVLLKSKAILKPYVVIFIEDIDPEELRTLLAQYLQEEEHSEPLLEKLLLYFGF